MIAAVPRDRNQKMQFMSTNTNHGNDHRYLIRGSASKQKQQHDECFPSCGWAYPSHVFGCFFGTARWPWTQQSQLSIYRSLDCCLWRKIHGHMSSKSSRESVSSVGNGTKRIAAEPTRPTLLSTTHHLQCERPEPEPLVNRFHSWELFNRSTFFFQMERDTFT